MSRPSNATQLADQLDALVASPNGPILTPDERAALGDAAKQLRAGTSPLWVLTRLLRKALGSWRQ